MVTLSSKYDMGDNHISFELTDEELADTMTYTVIRNRVKHWVLSDD